MIYAHYFLRLDFALFFRITSYNVCYTKLLRIEFADSVGVDVVNSSLGYYKFDGDNPQMDFTYADMNGKASRASRAATLAAKKGIIVVVSAGNEGSTKWHYIGSPADAEGIISVGSVTADGDRITSYNVCYTKLLRKTDGSAKILLYSRIEDA